MAMIKCEECGNMISTKAPNCIHCGAPIPIVDKVRIKIPRFTTGSYNDKSSETEIKCEGKILWHGYSGEIAEFEIAGEKAFIDIYIKAAYTGHPFPFYRNFTITGQVSRGKKHEVKMERASLVFNDPTRADWRIIELDENDF